MEVKRTSLSVVIIGAISLAMLTTCGKGKREKQVNTPDGITAKAETDSLQETDVTMNSEEWQTDSPVDELCPVDPSSPYWYDPNQEEVTFSDDKCTLLRFPRIKKGGEYVVPQSVRYIEERAFQGCRNLVALRIPKTVKHIGMAPFENCGKLEILEIRCQLDTLPFRFVGGCSNLRAIYLADKVPPFIEECSDAEEEQAVFDLNFYGVSKEKCVIFVPHGSASLYWKTPVWRMFQHILD